MPNNFRHEAIIDVIISCPQMTKGEIASYFGYTQAWLSTLMNSDAFQMQLAERRMRFEDNLDEAAKKRLHDLDAAASAIIEKELAKVNADPHYALAVKKTIQPAVTPAKNKLSKFAENVQIIQNNNQINQSVLERARNKMRRVEQQFSLEEDDLVASVAG